MNHQQDDAPTAAGEGITYTSKPGTRMYAVEVPFPGRRPMRCTIRAISPRQALQFAIARHPGAFIDGIRILHKSEAPTLYDRPAA